MESVLSLSINAVNSAAAGASHVIHGLTTGCLVLVAFLLHVLHDDRHQD